MLTRTSEKNDMAPDGSVYPAVRDPQTGGRQLEELALEVVSRWLARAITATSPDEVLDPAGD